MEAKELELFESPVMIIDDDTIIDRFTCCLVCFVNGTDEVIGKRRFKIRELKGQGYIGFDAYNHLVKAENTERIRITHIGKDYIDVFIRSPYTDNIPSMHRVSFEHNNLTFTKDCKNGVVYKLIIRIKLPGDDPQ